MPFIAYLFYAVSAGFFTAIGRAHLGIEAARPSRYITVSNLFWIGVVVIWYLFYQQIHKRRIYSFVLKLLPVLFITFLVCVVLSSYRSLDLLISYSARFREERAAALEYAKTGKLTVFYQNAETMKQRIEVLRKYKLSVFRE